MTAERRPLPATRRSVTHKTTITSVDPAGDYNVFITVGLYDDGTLGEVFLRIGKAGSTLNGLCDTISILVSFALQHGIPLETLAHRLTNTMFSPAGQTTNPNIPTTSSIADYLFRFLTQLDSYLKAIVS